MDINEFRNMTDHALFGLTADDSLKQKILTKASEYPDHTVSRNYHIIPVFCTVLTALILSVVLLNGMQPVNPSAPGEINVFAAGSHHYSNDEEVQSDSILPGIDDHSVRFLEVQGLGTIDDSDLCADLIRILQNRSEKVDDQNRIPQKKLLVSLDNGNAFEFYMDDPYIFNGDYWLCPDFFSKIHEISDQNQ